MPGRRPTPTLVKLIRGTAQPCRLRDDRPRVAAPPQVPPGTVLSGPERLMFDWLLEHVALPGVHGSGDGPAFVKAARLWARVQECDAKIVELGLVATDPKTKRQSLRPYTRLSRDLWRHVGIAFAEIGATPAGRVKLAGPRSSGPTSGPTAWDEID